MNNSAKIFGASPAYFINMVIALLLMACFKYVPAVEPLTPLGMEIIGIFLGMLYGWLIVGDLFWPCIIGMIFLGLSDYTTVAGAFKATFGNNTALLVFFFFIFTNIISEAGVTVYIANWIAKRKIAQGKPYVLSLFLVLAMIVLILMVSAIAACMVMYTILKEVARIYGFEPGEAWPKHMLIGLTYVGCTAYCLLPFKALPLVCLGSYEQLSGNTVNMPGYLTATLLLTIGAVIVFLLVLRFVLKPDVSKIAN